MSNQFLSITSISIRSLPARAYSSLVIIVGIGGVVAVIIALLAMAKGFEQTLATTGKADRALVLRAGSSSEINGNVPLLQFDIISRVPASGASRQVKASKPRNICYSEYGKKRQSTETASLPMRGTDQNVLRR